MLESGGNYFVLTSDGVSVRAGHGALRVMPICNSKPVVNGRLYAIDHSGKLLWPAPVKIESQMFPLDQPADLPILTFACRALGYWESGGKGSYKLSLLCIDKRSGRTAYRMHALENHQMTFFGVLGDTDKKTVSVMDWSNTVTLTFTDKPWPPDSPLNSPAGKSP